jgi:6-phosphogluconolactonase
MEPFPFASPMLGRRDLLRMAAGSAALLAPRATPAAGKSWLVFWGTYTEGNSPYGKGSKGIYVSRFDSGTGKLTEAELAGESVNPSWILVHPNGRYLYAANEYGDGNNVPPGDITAFSINRKTGRLTGINRVPSGGGQPCHLCLDRTSRMLMVANWSTASVAAFPVRNDGGLGASTGFSHHEGARAGAPGRGQPQNHCHSVAVTPDNRFLLTTNTGLNKVFVYRLNAAKTTFTPHDPPFLGLEKPTNPRHLALHPSVKWAYVANETAPGGCTMLKFDAARGVLEEGPVFASVPADYKGRGSQAECKVHPSGRFVYVSNRGHDSIAAFRINLTDGTLTLVDVFKPGGETPRSFGIDPTGNWLLSMMQRTGNIAALRIDGETGKLSDIGVKRELPSPVCAAFLAAA